MPYVNIKITRVDVTTEQKATLIRETTAMLARVLNKDPRTTHVVIDEIGASINTTPTMTEESKKILLGQDHRAVAA